MTDSSRRQSDPEGEKFSAQRQNNGGIRLRIAGQQVVIPGTMLGVSFFLGVLLLWFGGAFTKWGVESPLVPRNGVAKAQQEVLATLNARMPLSREEHVSILDQLEITNYILTECLRMKGECPRLKRPKGLRVAGEP